MYMFDNKTECGIYATEFIMSWIREGGTLGRERRNQDYKDFRKWLETLIIDGKSLSEKDVNHIVNLSHSGKLELEESARGYLKTLKTE